MKRGDPRRRSGEETGRFGEVADEAMPSLAVGDSSAKVEVDERASEREEAKETGTGSTEPELLLRLAGILCSASQTT